MPKKTSVMTKSKQRDVILHFWCEGVRNANEIHRRTNIGLSTIYYNLKKLEKTGDVARKPVSGRPRKITGSAANVIGQQIRRNPQITRKGLVQKLEEKGIKVSKDTVGRYLQRQGYKNALPIATPMLTAEHKKKRVEWAKKHIDDVMTGHEPYSLMKLHFNCSEIPLHNGISIKGQFVFFLKIDKKFMPGVDFRVAPKPVCIALLV